MPTSIYDIQVDGGWAYIATRAITRLPEKPGVTVYDIHDPYNPTLLGILPQPGAPHPD